MTPKSRHAEAAMARFCFWAMVVIVWVAVLARGLGCTLGP